MKKIFSFAFAILMIAGSVLTFAFALSVPEPTKDFFVNDFAGVISSSDKAKIQKAGEKLYNQCKAQVVVATIETLDGNSIEDYSLAMARSWKIGDSEKNNGVLLLLAVKERKVRIEVGYGLEGALPDSKTGRLLDLYAIPPFKNNDFSGGLSAVYNALINEVGLEYGVVIDSSYEPVEDNAYDSDDYRFFKGEAVLLIMVVILIFVLLFIKSLFGGGRGGRNYRGGNYRGGTFNSGGYSGGFSSGGGGGFSGGGGSFGGGGSSRGF